MLVFTSDNGWLEGEHRIEGKAVPYEEAIRVPLVIWAPPRVLGGGRAPETVDQPVANTDLAPTLLQMASASPCRNRHRCRLMDGRSLLPLLKGNATAWPHDRAVLLESREGDFGVCQFEAVRTRTSMYAEYSPFASGASGTCAPPSDRELYDLGSDPEELQNIIQEPAASGIESQLKARLDRLRDCAGIQGRESQLDGRPYCE